MTNIKATLANYYTDEADRKFAVFHIQDGDNTSPVVYKIDSSIDNRTGDMKFTFTVEHIAAADHGLACDLPYRFFSKALATNNYVFVQHPVETLESIINSFRVDKDQSFIRSLVSILKPEVEDDSLQRL